MNQIIVSGRLASNPELKQTKGDKSIPMCTFVLAVNRPSKERKADFPTVVTWRGVAEFAAKHLRKGQRIIIHGEIRTHDFINGEGKKHKITEIQADRIEFAENKITKQEDEYEASGNS